MSIATCFFAQPSGPGNGPLEGKFASSVPRNAQAAGEETIPLSKFAGLYWFAEIAGEHKAVSTEEVAVALDNGFPARAISGPFRSRAEAAQSLERYWEMLMDDDPDSD